MNAGNAAGVRTMIVTGASSGIGRALALRAARAGFAVYGIGRDRAALAALAERIRAEDGLVAVDAVDVSRPEHARTIVVAALAAFGRIDVLVNNAGAVAAGPLAAQSDEALRVQFGTHVEGPVALVREALRALYASGGHVFNVGSGVARVPVGGLGAYPASKAAIRSATATLRRELQPLGIAVTYVDPGAVDTPFMRRSGMPGAPARLLVAPEEVARRILLAVGTRRAVLNAAPFSAFATALAERTFPRLTDALLARVPDLVGAGERIDLHALAAAPEPPAPAAVMPPPAAPGPAPDVETALAPLARRMERSGLRSATVQTWLATEGALLVPNDLAVGWAGMPNKHERALTGEVLEALAAAGVLAREADRYRVTRGG